MSLSSLLPPGLSLQDAIKLFYQVVGDTFAVNLAAAAATTWIAYDICLTFSEEVELVWKAKWSLPKVMYICVRYYGLAASILYLAVNSSPSPPFGPAHRCRGWPYFEAFGAATLISAFFGEGMFVLRLWAAFKSNKKVRAVIAFCFFAEIASSIIVGVIEARTITILPHPPNFPLPGCYTLASIPLKNTLGAWIVNCSVATTYFALMLYKFVTSESVKLELSNVKRAKWTELPRISPLIFLLFRDGVMYFAMIFMVNIANMILSIKMEGRALEGMGVAWTFAVSSVASSRLLLNLRGLIRGQDTVTRTAWSTIQFEDHVPGEDLTDGVSEDSMAATTSASCVVSPNESAGDP